jgi:hypothetical protein
VGDFQIVSFNRQSFLHASCPTNFPIACGLRHIEEMRPILFPTGFIALLMTMKRHISALLPHPSRIATDADRQSVGRRLTSDPSRGSPASVKARCVGFVRTDRGEYSAKDYGRNAQATALTFKTARQGFQ